MSIRSLALCFAVLALGSLARATTWVVDAAGGAGSHFTTIQAAIDAAAPGDTVVVRPGTYAGFAVDKRLCIRSLVPAAVLQGAGSAPAVRVHGLVPGQRVVVSGFRIPGEAPLNDPVVVVQSCSAPVLLHQLEGPTNGLYTEPIAIASSSDVRIAQCTSFYVRAESSRLEVTSSRLIGRDGWTDSPPGAPGVDGATALRCVNSAVHVAASVLFGGAGGDDCWDTPGSGGHGIDVQGGSVLVSGTSDPQSSYVWGGPGGFGEIFCATQGPSGLPVRLAAGEFRHSGMPYLVSYLPGPPAVPQDPCLSAVGTGIAGSTMTYRLHGQPGDVARLRVGQRLVLADVPGVLEDQLTIPIRTYELGLVPPSGFVQVAFHVPTALAPDFTVVFQGETLDAQGQLRLTQSAPFAIR